MDTILSTDEITGATLVEHTFPADVPVCVVVNCSPPPGSDIALAAIEEGIVLARSGDAPGGASKIAEGQKLLEQLANDGPAQVTVRPLSVDELAQCVADEETSAAAVAAAEKEASARDALVLKLSGGTASDSEVQSAIAQILGPPSTA